MKALILIGGYGTRLRPLTLSIPKPLVKFCNKAILVRQIEALVEIDVTNVILAIGRTAECFEKSIRESVKHLNVSLEFSYEEKPLGTGGPLGQAKSKLLDKDESICFFVLNSDVICNYPLKDMLNFHLSHGHEATMAIYQVDEPARFGAVVYDKSSQQILRFQEKPDSFISNKINAGLYVFNKSILNRIPIKRCSIEIEIFPKMVEEGELFSFEFKGFWMDIGKPNDFLLGVSFYLGYLFEQKSPKLATGHNILGNVIIDNSVTIDSSSFIGPNVVLGRNVTVKSGCRIRNSTILSDTIVDSHTWIDTCLIGWNCEIGSWVRMENNTVLGEDVRVNDELFINGALVLPHKEITESVYEPRTII